MIKCHETHGLLDEIRLKCSFTQKTKTSKNNHNLKKSCMQRYNLRQAYINNFKLKLKLRKITSAEEFQLDTLNIKIRLELIVLSLLTLHCQLNKNSVYYP